MIHVDIFEWEQWPGEFLTEKYGPSETWPDKQRVRVLDEHGCVTGRYRWDDEDSHWQQTWPRSAREHFDFDE